MYDIEGPETWSPGDLAWFEYHCLESWESMDADLWLRSHQLVTVLTEPELNDAPPGMTQAERFEAATLHTYTVRFADGHEGCAVEDELMLTPADFYRPDPPSSKGK